ncbi:MAG: hypothetical protein IT486_09765 [Gammaproteobacteria bacterium]|nr:hypothetical protein [Gammaproteobacteria bacterium]
MTTSLPSFGEMRAAPVRDALHGLAGLATAILLGACEAPLNLDGVQRQEATPIRRSDMYQEAAANERALVVVGNHGLVLRSTDAGQNWQRQELPGWPSLIDVTACPDGRLAALAAESQMIVSADDGQTWTTHPLATEESPQGITCDPANRLWVVGSFSTIMFSADGGENWQDRSTGEDTIFTTIQFIDATHAVVFGEFGSNVHSTDGGETWTPGTPLPNEFYAQDTLFLDGATGWVAGLAGQILHTADGGATWALQKSPVPVPIYGFTRLGADVYAVGGEGVLLRQQAGEWVRIEHGQPVRQLLRVLQPVGVDRLLIGGAAGALYVVPAATAG